MSTGAPQEVRYSGPVPSVTRRASARTQRRGAAEARIFEALERLLRAGERFTTLGVQRIADEAGVARSTFYVHFADKTELLLRFEETTTRTIFDAAEAWSEQSELTVEGLRDAVAAMLASYRDHAWAYAALAEVAAYDPEVAAAWSARVESFAEAFRQRIDGLRAGTTARDAGPLGTPTATRWIAWGVERVISQQAQREDRSADAQFVDELAAAIWAVIQ